jgi:hypothetical protein
MGRSVPDEEYKVKHIQGAGNETHWGPEEATKLVAGIAGGKRIVGAIDLHENTNKIIQTDLTLAAEQRKREREQID